MRIIEADPEECFDLLLADQADVAVVVATGPTPLDRPTRGSSSATCSRTRSTCWCRTATRWRRRRRCCLADLADEPWIMDRPGRPYHQLLQTACAAAGFTPAVAHQATEWDTGAALVAAGLGIALIPRLAHLPAGYPIVAGPAAGRPDALAPHPHRDPPRQLRSSR